MNGRSPVAMAAIPAPWGFVHVAVGRRGVVACESLTPPDAFAATIERRLRCDVVTSATPLLDGAVAQIEEYLEGRRRVFELEIEIDDRPDWDRRVLTAVSEIPWGSVTTYGGIARAIDRPGAARAVGGAVGRSPIGIVVPCHRVLAADGTLGGYGADWSGSRQAGLDVKRELLAIEGIATPAHG